MRFTAENAREYAKRSHLPTSKRNLPPPPTPPEPQKSEPATQAANQPAIDDPLAAEITRAIQETLADLRQSDNAKDRAAFSQALKNLRETYHMVTGIPKPGLRKGGLEKPAYSGPAASLDLQPEQAPPETPPQ